ncbi:OB-fold putative lipoprotein [bacterium]|nr:OB-fold putative lipoprotein [bacterium]MDB4633107.1 OB-fold putative lipoprotein [bacterium]MDB4780385.1 OB-fold putative lipoprotein [bacterium]
MRTKTYKHFASLLVASVFAVVAIGSIETDEDTRKVQSQAATYKMTANEIIKAYSENEVKADLKYDEKVVELTGRVEDIGKDIADKTYILLGKFTSADFLPRSVQCYFTDGEVRSVAGLSNGDVVTVKGRIDGLMLNVQMKTCKILPSK